MITPFRERRSRLRTKRTYATPRLKRLGLLRILTRFSF